MDTPSLVQQLKSQPNVVTLHSILRLLVEKSPYSDLQQLEIVTALLTRTVPETYSLLESKPKQTICELLCNRIGLSQLIIRLRAGEKHKIYARVLADSVQSTAFASILDQVTRPKLPESKLLLLHKIPDALNQEYLESRDSELDSASSEYPWRLLQLVLSHVSTLEKERSFWPLLNGCFSLKLALFDNLFHQKQLLTNLFSAFNNSNDHTWMKRMVEYLTLRVNTTNNTAYARILQELHIVDWDSVLLIAQNSPNIEVFKAFSILAPQSAIIKTLHKCMVAISSQINVRQTPFLEQQRSVKVVALLVQRCSQETITKLSSEPAFLECVTHRLQSNSPQIRSLGMVIGDLVYEAVNNGKPMFDIPEHLQWKQKFLEELRMDPVQGCLDDALVAVTKKSASVVAVQDVAVVESFTTTTTTEFDSDPEDSDDDEAEGTPVTGTRKNVPTPVYLKEVISYLQAEPGKDQLAYDKHRILHAVLPQLIRTKANTQELQFYNEALLDLVIGLTNSFKFDEFEEWKLSSLISITTGDFDGSAEYLIKAFVSGDLSLSVRVMILSCLSLSVREKCGFQDHFVPGKERLENVGARMLPPALHKQFLLYDTIGEQKQLKSVSNGLAQLSLPGTVTRRSANLNKKPTGVTKNTSFINKQLPKLFFQLVSVWRVANSTTGKGFQIGQFSPILNSHYLKTLSLILECAIPSCTQLLDMLSEILSLAVEQLRILLSNYEEIMMDSVITCLRTVLLYDNVNILGTGFAQELLLVQGYLSSLVTNGVILDSTTANKCGELLDGISRILRK